MAPPKSLSDALRKFTGSLNHITKLRDNEEINNIEFRHRYWAAVRQFVKKNGWIPLCPILGEAQVKGDYQTVIKDGWSRLLGKPSKKRRAGISRTVASIFSEAQARGGKARGGKASDCIWW